MSKRRISARNITVVAVKSAIAADMLNMKGLLLLFGWSIRNENARITTSGRRGGSITITKRDEMRLTGS